jgi:hypothetical protein
MDSINFGSYDLCTVAIMKEPFSPSSPLTEPVKPSFLCFTDSGSLTLQLHDDGAGAD